MIESQQTTNKVYESSILLHTRFRLIEAVVMKEHFNGNKLLYSESPAYILITSASRHGHIVIDGILNNLSPERIYIIHPGQRVELTYPTAKEQTLYLLYFDFSMSEETDSQPDFSRIEWEMNTTLSSERLLPLCRKITDHWYTDDAADRFASEAGFQDLLHLLFKKQRKNENTLDQVRQFMELHYPEALTVDNLVRMAGMSRYYFMRTFKERFGQSAMEYLKEVRMNRAKQYLEEGRTLYEIAEKVGYKDSQYFSSQFKKYTGISPSIYIANRNDKIAAYSWPNIGHLLTLQIIPYAAPIDQLWTDEYRKKYRFDIKVPLSHDYDFNREALWRAKPDKIVALEEMIPEEEKEKLRQIAPVLFLSWHKDNWRRHLQMTAKFLDREEEGEKWLARYEEKVAAVRKCVPFAVKQGTLLILNFCPEGIRVWGRRAGTVLYDDLQVAYAKGVEQIEYTKFLEVEQLEQFDADVLLVHVMKDLQSQKLWMQVQKSRAWTNLKSIRNHNVYQTSSPAWIAEPIMEYTAYRHEQLLHELQQLFSAF